MTATDRPQPMLPSAAAAAPRPCASPPCVSPSLKLPWMQALIHAGAQLAHPDEAVTEATGAAKDAVHYVLCGCGPGTVEEGTDFLTAVAAARRLVATGARRIVFLTFGDTAEGRLQQSLLSFSRHAGRALTANPAEFTVIPVDRPLSAQLMPAQPDRADTLPAPARRGPEIMAALRAQGLISPVRYDKPRPV